MEQLNFLVDRELCVGCGECVRDCPYLVLAMDGDVPVVQPGRAEFCIRCQHCLAICPVGALSIHGADPADCPSLAGAYPTPEALEVLMRGRRTCRRYRDEDVDAALVRRLLTVAWQAPTGVNARQVLFTVVDDRQTMARLRGEVMARLAEVVRAQGLPEGREFFASFVSAWEAKGIDTIFRGAPHLLIASAPKDCPCPKEDCLIALSYFELLAQCHGLGTVWSGLAKWTIDDLLPEFRTRLGIPAEHLFGYAMVFGWPAISYHRTVSLRPALLNRVALG